MKSVEIYAYDGIGYEKLFHHQNWRVAVLNYIDELEVDHINYVEAHAKTDEVFVLLNGSCTLFLVEDTNPNHMTFQKIDLEQHKIYKIPAGIFHTHTLSKDAKVLVIEEENTCYDNSPRIYLNENNKKTLASVHKG